MIPLPASRKSSYNLLARRPSRLDSSFSYRSREPSAPHENPLKPEATEAEEGEDEDEDGMGFEERLAMEEEVEGMEMGDRGLENTLEKLGFGESPFACQHTSSAWPL